MLFVGASVVPNVSGKNSVAIEKNKDMDFIDIFTNGAPEVWVDDDYYDGGYNDGHTWGYDAFDNVQDGVDNVLNDGKVNVKEGSYDVFQVEGRTNILIIGEGQPIVIGNQIVYDASYPDYVYNVVFVDESFDTDNPDSNEVLAYLERVNMAVRRNIFIVLISQRYRTMDNMMAFNKSVNMVINVKNIGDIHKILGKGITDNDFFYNVFMEAMRKIGKA